MTYFEDMFARGSHRLLPALRLALSALSLLGLSVAVILLAFFASPNAVRTTPPHPGYLILMDRLLQDQQVHFMDLHRRPSP